MSFRAHNFGAGPCTLPLSVLEEVQAEFLNYDNTGMSLIEISHRSKPYEEMHFETITLLRELYQIPNDFEVLFIQGGASLQFAMIPQNFLSSNTKGAYINSGIWASKALEECQKFFSGYAAWDGGKENFTRMPQSSEIQIEEKTTYLHLTSNETIGGLRMTEWPQSKVSVIADMSSDFLSRKIPWDHFDMVYGGVQKNLGPSGMAVVMIRKSLLELCQNKNYTYLSYQTHSKNDSLYNTPPMFPIYIMNKVLKWMKAKGGLSAIENLAVEKAAMIYDMIDLSNGFYSNPINKENRSLMNIVFRLPTEELENQFLKIAEENNMIGLKGHRSVGGCRASLYNALPNTSAKALAELMKDFMNKEKGN